MRTRTSISGPGPHRCNLPVLALLGLLGLGCGTNTTEPQDQEGGGDPGTTTPSSVPVGDYPDIPLPTDPGGTTVTRSDTSTIVEPLATDFRPAILGLTADAWSVGQADGGPSADLPIRTCFYNVFEGTGASSQIIYATRYVECPLIEGGAWWYVRYPDRGAFIDTWLAWRYEGEREGIRNAYRPHLVEAGTIKEPEPRTTLFHEIEIEWYVGDQDLTLGGVGREGCALKGTIPPSIPCRWRNITSASMERRPLTSPVYVRQDVFWEKAGNSEIFPNFQAGANSHSFTREWTVGTEDTETEEFGRTVSGQVGGEIDFLKAAVSGTLNETFGTSVTVTTAEKRSETFQMTIAGNTTAVFEIWNLTEQYTFVNEDGTPYEDPNYRFALSDLTRKATIATARTTVEFPND